MGLMAMHGAHGHVAHPAMTAMAPCPERGRTLRPALSPPAHPGPMSGACVVHGCGEISSKSTALPCPPCSALSRLGGHAHHGAMPSKRACPLPPPPTYTQVYIFGGRKSSSASGILSLSSYAEVWDPSGSTVSSLSLSGYANVSAR